MTGPSTEDLLALIGDIYDSAIEPTRWPSTLARLTDLMHGTAAAIALHNPYDNTVRLDAKHNIDENFERAMIENVAINPAMPMVWYVDVGAPFSAAEAIGDEEMRNSLWYNRTLAPMGYHDAAIAVLAKSVHRFGSLSILRQRHLPNYSREELGTLALIAPHIGRAVMIADMLDARALERDMLAAALDRLAVGIVLTERNGCIVHANEAANRYLDDGVTLRRDGDQLTARNPASASALAQAITSAASGITVDIPYSGIVVTLESDHGDLAAWVLPLDSGLRRELGIGFAARVAVFIRDLGDTQPFPAELFVRRYAITPAECRVMMLLVHGLTITEAAETLGIGLPTAKTHLARLFQKTATQRQADLVRLAMSALAPASRSA